MRVPAVSAVVATRDRPADLADCVASILANSSPDFELLVVDQSQSNVPRQVLEAHRADPRLRHLHSEERGLSRARNRGAVESRGAIVAFTDDDCRVPPDWVDGLRRRFESEPKTALLFAAVRSRTGIPQGAFVPVFYPTSPLVADWRPRLGVDWGIGANMALRRELFDEIGPFDAVLGAGGPLLAGEETDYTVRALARGRRIAHAADPAVVHLHELSGPAASRHWRGYGVGVGAAYAKHARLGTGGGGSRLLREEVGYKLGLFLRRVARRESPTNFTFLAGLIVGALQSLRWRIDGTRNLYLER